MLKLKIFCMTVCMNKYFQACFMLLVLFIGLFSATGFAQKCDGVRQNVLRLHVIANSDSEADQSLKLLVRDRILQEGSQLFDGSVNAEDAKERICPEIDELESVARELVRVNGFDYGVKITVEEEYFDTRSYEGFTMPAGRYEAVKIILGEGAGKNWWCIMFPPLCLPAAEKKNEDSLEAILTNGEIRVIENNSKYEIRFKIVEIYEKIKESLKQN